MSIASSGCVVWLQRFEPGFVSLAVCALVYQGWLVWRRPAHRRTLRMRVILWASLGANLAVGGTLAALWLRYW